MKQTILLFFLILFSISCVTKQSDDHNEIQFDDDKYISTWVDMWNSYDLNMVDSLFFQDDRITYFSSEKVGAITGFDAVKEHHKGFGFVEGGKEQTSKLWVEGVRSSDFGNTAVITGIWYFQRADSTIQKGPMTVVYVESEGRFKIAHMNFGNYLDGEPE